MAATLPQAVVHIVPAARSLFTAADVRELWDARALLLELVRRDIRVRYAQTALGAAWALLQPLAGMAVFTVVFGMIARLPSGHAPYPLIALAGLVPWTYFANAVAASSESLVTGRDLITKIWFPRLVMPLAPVVAGLLDFAIGMATLLLAVLIWGGAPSPLIVLLPLPIVLMMVAATGLGAWASALNVQFRDVRYVIPFVLQLGLFLSPVIYSLDSVAERWRLLFALNPMAGVIELVRALLLHGAVAWDVTAVSAVSALLLLVSGVMYFRHVEQRFADIV